jgi:hypothetical protein
VAWEKGETYLDCLFLTRGIPADVNKSQVLHQSTTSYSRLHVSVVIAIHHQAFYTRLYTKNCKQLKKDLKPGNAFLHTSYTRVAQKVIPHILFLGNYLFRMHEIHAQYNWMFPLHMLFFRIISIYVYGPPPARNKGMHAFPVPGRFLFA